MTKNDPPMIVGNIYENMSCFKLALATHAIINEFEFNREKNDPRRYRPTAVPKLMDVGGGFLHLQL